MDRNRTLTNEEIADLSIELRRVEEIDNYCLRVQGVIGTLFPGAVPFCYHYYDGRGHFVGLPEDVLAGMLDMARKLPFIRPDIMAKFHNEFSHSANTAELLKAEVPELAAMLEPFKDRAEFQAGGCYLEGPGVFLGTAGAARPNPAGDFTDAEIENLKTMTPFIGEGLRGSARFSRAKRFGDAFAVAMENHPTALFLFTNDNKLIYANAEAKSLMQNDPTYMSNVPAIEFSVIPARLVEKKHGAQPDIPGAASVTYHHLPDWPELNLEAPWLALVNSKTDDLGVTEREAEVLQALAEKPNQREAAEVLGVTETTFRTHVQKICRKLDVSGSNAALTLWALSASGRGD